MHAPRVCASPEGAAARVDAETCRTILSGGVERGCTGLWVSDVHPANERGMGLRRKLPVALVSGFRVKIILGGVNGGEMSEVDLTDSVLEAGLVRPLPILCSQVADHV